MITYPFVCDSCDCRKDVKASIKSQLESPTCPYCKKKMRRVWNAEYSYGIPRGKQGNAANGYRDEIYDILDKKE